MRKKVYQNMCCFESFSENSSRFCVSAAIFFCGLKHFLIKKDNWFDIT